ncbi:acyltransferase [Vibrio vulnificus]|uniref:acyltransferase family protein n=1 Tax=Vibrio vulnificus TaxID=672 RepID=UPI0010291B97|nr:acyltransferase family protein [Vibrio vulnificus]RZP84158.1 acyltransferase [Vibrio vulnificus]RZP84512.1 acyltransferase [Vibrio vulnificus]
MKFRQDINGLRAIAVLGVITFHFFPNAMPGGFSGVDVFFVISGFLMTGIIVESINKDDFSILRFYKSRFNRIAPALVVLCITLIILGWFILMPLDYKLLGKHITNSILFFSNVIYLRESGYFDVSSYEKWLLHTWSLSVEWQFYLLYPCVILLLRRFFDFNIIKKAIFLMTLLGFIVSAYMSYTSPNSAYYLLVSRSWQMFIGGVVYLFPFYVGDKCKIRMHILGIILIVFSYFFISQHLPWPGVGSLLPVIGAALILCSNYQGGFISQCSVFRSVGSWSYSIYIWHWPVVVFLYYYDLQGYYFLFGLFGSILLGFISYRYIELVGYIYLSSNVKNSYFVFLIVVFISVGIVGRVIYKTNGMEWHYSEMVVNSINEVNNVNPRKKECHVGTGKVPECVYGGNEIAVIVIGDSHAQSIIRSVEKSLPKGRGVLDWTMSGCRTISSLYNTFNHGLMDHSCGEFVSYAIDRLSDYPRVPIIVDNRYNYTVMGPNEPELISQKDKVMEFIPSVANFERRDEVYISKMNEAFVETLCKLSKNNPLFILEQTPEMKQNVPQTMAREFMKGNEDFRVKLPIEEYQERNAIFTKVVSKLSTDCGIKLISVVDKFCDNKYCYGDIEGRPVYFDDDHLSEFGASKLIPEIEKQLQSHF